MNSELKKIMTTPINGRPFIGQECVHDGRNSEVGSTYLDDDGEWFVVTRFIDGQGGDGYAGPVSQLSFQH